jgi:hypothetical protein
MVNQFSLNHSNQITVIIVDYKPNRAAAPSTSPLELCKPASMLLIFWVKYNPRTAKQLQATHLLTLTLALKKPPMITTANQDHTLYSIASTGNRVFNAQIVNSGPMMIRATITTIQKITFIVCSG